MADIDLQSLRANPRFMVQELLRRGIQVECIDPLSDVFEALYGEHRELLLDIDSSLMPFAVSSIASSKSVTKFLLARAGINVPRGSRFTTEELEPIAIRCASLRAPFVVKPALGEQGAHVYLNLETPEEVLHAVTVIAQERGPSEILLEEQFDGEEYRIFMTRRGEYAVLHRDPAYVVGDGRSSIEALAAFESHRRMNPRNNCLCEIVLDGEAERFLRRQGLTRRAIPVAGEKVYVRANSNIKTGGVCTDMSDIVHPSVLELAARVLHAIPGLPYGGIDFMTRDITKPQSGGTYAVLEVNSLPGLGMHHAPAFGSPRNVAGMIVDMLFPETALGSFSRIAA